ncbi:MAG: tetratricopeptide repeat protein [Lutibacter sp.]|jgi:tetratricopeptide (TPR) repeat protein
MKTYKITNIIMIWAALQFSVFAHAQIEEKDDNGLIKTYYPTIQQISREQLIAKINDNIGKMLNLNYYTKNKGYQSPINSDIKKLVVYDDRFQDQKSVLFYYKEIADKKIFLIHENSINKPFSVVDFYLNEENDIMMYRFIFESKVLAKEFAENMYCLIHSENLAEESLSKADSILFNSQAAQYKEMKVKPTITEGQRKYIVQANFQNQQKNYIKAIQLFKKVIELDKTAYPSAYSNLALLYAQTNNFQIAINYMKMYLLLEPESTDARGAQDKIYEWEAQIVN